MILSMRNFTPYCSVLAAALLCAPVVGFAQNGEHRLVKKEQRTLNVQGHKVPLFAGIKSAAFSMPSATSLTTGTSAKNAARKSWGNVSEAEEILTEDFDKFTKGTPDAPDTEALCDEYGYFGGPAKWDIDSQFTEVPGWCGTGVFSAGGYAYLNDPQGYSGAMLNSPLGDYSGKLTITLRIKNIGSQMAIFNINMLKGGYKNPTFANVSEGDANESVNLYPNKGWKTITMQVKNLSSVSDGFLQLLCYGQCLVDYIHITRECDFIAAPTMLPETNFTDNSFTANWQKVDMATGYWLWLYERKEKGTEDRAWKADFESTLPEDFKTNGSLKAGEGADGSQGLMLAPGDTLITPYNFSTYKSAKYWLQAVGDEDELYSSNSTIHIDLLTYNGWVDFGDFYADEWVEPADVDMQEATQGKFNGIYYGMRIYPVDFPKDAYVMIDNMDIQAGKDAELATVGINEEYGMYYDDTKKTSYTFSDDIEPDKDYYYVVQSHYVKVPSESNLNFAFGVAAPKVNEATAVSKEGYTANWEPSVKATGYRVDNFGMTTAPADGDFAVLDEDFSLINADVTSSTNPKNPEQGGSGTNKYESLDGYTKVPGWTVRNMGLTQGWMGGITDASIAGSLKTPALYLANGSSFKLTVKAVGKANASLGIQVGGNDYTIPFDENGEIDGTFTIPECGTAVTLRFYSSATFMIDQVKVSQDMKAGDKVYALLGSTTVDGKETTSASFSGLDKAGFNDYAFAVTAIRDNDPYYTESELSDYVSVDMNAATGIESVNKVDVNDVAVRFNANGQRIATLQRGVNIIKYKNGTVRKTIVK